MAISTGQPSNLYRVRIGLALAATDVLLTACGGSSKSASAGIGASTSPAAAASTSKAASSSGSAGTNLGGGSFCDKAKQASANVSSAAASLSTSTPDKIKTFEDNALAELNSLKDQAPDAIKGQIGTLVAAETTLVDDLKGANYDFTKVSSQIATQFSSPQFTQAIAQIDSYLETKCGIKAPAAAATP